MEWPDFEPEPALGLFIYATGDGGIEAERGLTGSGTGYGYGYGNYSGGGYGDGFGRGYSFGNGWYSYPQTLIVRTK